MKKDNMGYVRNRRRQVILKSYEIDLLEQMMIHRWMAAKGIHKYIQSHAPRKMHPNSISNRLRVFLENGLIFRKTKNISVTRAEVPQYYYRLSRRGYSVLVTENRMTEEEASRSFRQVKELGIPSTHTLAISTLANNIVVENRESKCLEFFHSRTLLESLIPPELRGLVIPDWVFTYRNRIICFELDTGTQYQGVIESKVKRYELLRASLEPRAIHLVVFFAVLDSSVSGIVESKKNDRRRRITSIKKTISQTLEQGWEDYYVTSTHRAPHAVLALMYEWANNIKKGEDAFKCCVLMKNILSLENRYQLELFKTGNIEGFSKLSYTPALKIERNEALQVLLFLSCREGQVWTYALIENAMENSVHVNRVGSKNEAIGVAVYPDYEASTEDVMTMNIPTRLLVTDIETWEEANNGDKQIPQMKEIGRKST